MASGREREEADKPEEKTGGGDAERPGEVAGRSGTLNLLDALVKAGTGAASAWVKRASTVPKKPSAWARPWEDAAVAWLDSLVLSRPALSAMFAPLGLWLKGLGQMNRALDTWIRTVRGVSAKDLEKTMNVLRSMESRLLEVSDAVEDARERLHQLTQEKERLEARTHEAQETTDERCVEGGEREGSEMEGRQEVIGDVEEGEGEKEGQPRG